MSPPAASAAEIGHAAAAAHPEMQRAVADGPHNIGKKHTSETDGVEPAQLLLQSCNSDHCANTPSCNEAPRAHAAEKLPLRSLHAAGGALQQAMPRCVVRVPVDRLRHVRAVVGDADAAAAHRHGSERYGVPCCIGLHAIWDTTLCRAACLWKHSGSNLARFTKVGTAWIMPISSACKRCSIQLGNPSSD